MRKNGFIILAAVVSLAIAACGKEEPDGPSSGGTDTIPTTDTIPVVDTIPTDTVPAAPWYSSLVGTHWYGHIDWMVVSLHLVEDRYMDIVDDSTFIVTRFNIEANGAPFTEDTLYTTLHYSYNPDLLEFTKISSDGETEVYTLDTIEKTLTYSLPQANGNMLTVYHLIEE